jgi:hypothetical protein
MISQFNVDYAPNGIALNKGGKPSAVRLTMVMTEAAIHTKADYQPDGTISTETLAERNSGDGQADPSVDPSSVAGKNSEGGDE